MEAERQAPSARVGSGLRDLLGFVLMYGVLALLVFLWIVSGIGETEALTWFETILGAVLFLGVTIALIHTIAAQFHGHGLERVLAIIGTIALLMLWVGSRTGRAVFWALIVQAGLAIALAVWREQRRGHPSASGSPQR